MSQFSDIDEYGFKRDDSFDYESYGEVMTTYFAVMTNRRIKWEQLIKKNPSLYHNRNRKLKRYIRKGIPGSLRAEVWMRVSGAFALQSKSADLYQSLLNIQYDEEIVESIKIDLPRTFPENIFFETIKHKLFNVLAAYAHHNRQVGYCQGLNYIAGLILIVTKNEEWTFWLLKILIEDIAFEYHTKTMAGLIVDIAVLKELLNKREPAINDRMDDFGLPCAVISTKWLICLFAEVLPVETVLRIWDCLFFEGSKIIFRVALTLFLANKDEILETDDISALANTFRDIVKSPVVMHCHEFIKSIFILPGTLKRSTIERIREQMKLRSTVI